MSDTRDPAEEQQIADPRENAAPAIDAAGMGQETGEVPAELDDDTSTPSPDRV